jgi:hypothetical protein
VNSARTRRQHRRPLRGLGGLAATLALSAAAAGCGASGGPAAAPPQPPAVPGQASTGPDLTGVQLPDFVMPLIKGGISRPDSKLTPGDVTTTDATTVCALPPHGVRNPISFSMQTAVFGEYGYTTPAQQHKYILDYLVPWDLGGALDEANIWPAAVRGTGFYEKIQTDSVLRELVCRRALSLRQAQRDLETDWYAAWLRYVVATGHA